MDIFAKADELVLYAEKNLELNKRNACYIKNRLIEILSACGEPDSDDMDAIYGAMSLAPAEVNAKFQRLLSKNSKKATDWLYTYCVKNDYVKRAVLDKNPRFESEGLIITINKAKPEFRDPKKAVSGNSVAGGYPKCSICRENEGFAGRSKRTLRTVDITLGGEEWFWQYSPYGYFNEHGIAVNTRHIPMHVDKSTFVKLMDFVDQFPHYFIGCNAPLPRIGGSVLAHDHYQGGGEILPMHRAKAVCSLCDKNWKNAVIEVVDWRGTVVRVVSESRDAIVDICDRIQLKWLGFRDDALGIIPESDGEVHSAVSPTVVKTERGYEMSLIFRNNATSAEFPDGIFHAHPEFHAVKKESIGLIEAQGLFILPGRLEDELGEIERLVADGKALPPEYAAFKCVYDLVKAEITAAKDADAHKAMQRALGKICLNILENTAVFKDKALTVKFLKEMGLE